MRLTSADDTIVASPRVAAVGAGPGGRIIRRSVLVVATLREAVVDGVRDQIPHADLLPDNAISIVRSVMDMSQVKLTCPASPVHVYELPVVYVSETESPAVANPSEPEGLVTEKPIVVDFEFCCPTVQLSEVPQLMFD